MQAALDACCRSHSRVRSWKMPATNFVRKKPGLVLFLFSAQAILLILLVLSGLFVINRLGGPSYLLFKIRYGSEVSGWSQGRREMLEAVDALDPNAIVFIGDSITHQAEWGELLQNPHVKNRGVDGDTTDQVLSRLDGLKKIKPRAVLLMIGINDLASRQPSDVFSRIQLIVSRIANDTPQTDIIIQSVIPINNSVKYQYRNNEDVQALNTLLSFYCGQKNFRFIDVHKALVDQDGNLDRNFTFDGIHLNGAGYSRWVDLLRDIQ